MTNGNTNNNGPLGSSIFSAEGFAFAEFLTSRLSLPIIALLRFNFGERFFGEATGKLVLFSLLYFVASFASAGGGSLFSKVLFASFFACIFHTVVIWLRRQRGEKWHSRYPGRPLLSLVLPFVSTRVIRRWIEPLLLLFVSFLIAGQSPALETYLDFSALSIASLEALGAQRWRRMILDAQDKEIEAAIFNEEMSGKTATETKGFEIPVGLSGKRGESLKSLLAGLYSGTQEMLGSLKQEAAPQPVSAPAQRQTPAITPPDASILCEACNTLNRPHDRQCGYCHADLHATGALVT